MSTTNTISKNEKLYHNNLFIIIKVTTGQIVVKENTGYKIKINF